MLKTQTSLSIVVNKTVYWCDSTIALSWIKMSPNLLQTFVANRVTQIQEISDLNQWHVDSNNNPADYLSRGVEPNRLIKLNQWWNGPKWLIKDQDDWPSLMVNTENVPELKRSFYTHKDLPDINNSWMERFFNLTKLIRVTCYCLRFTNCLKPNSKRRNGHLTSVELENSLLVLAKLSQRSMFDIELNSLKKNQIISPKSRLLSLNPFLDENGILRVGGRLYNSNFNEDKKHTILISSKHYFTKLLFASEHQSLLHAGPQLLLASIRERFWPIGGRNLVKMTVHSCIRCYRANPNILFPIMGNLPAQRVSPAPPFL